jgi:hypothetical protein
MIIIGVTNYAILTILRDRLHYNYTLITLFRHLGPTTLIAAYACAYIYLLGLLSTP